MPAASASAAPPSTGSSHVPASERHGNVRDQGPFWFLGNFHFFTIAIGFLGPSFGLSLGYSVLAGALGIVFGTFFMAFHATQGPRSTRSTPIVVAVFLGASLSAIWLIAVGAWIASRLGATDGLVALRDAGDNIFHGLGSLLAELSVLALVATMRLNAYSGMLSAVTGVDSGRSVSPTRGIRVVTIVILSVVWAIVGIGFGGNFLSALFSALQYMLYLLVPWTAINLVDYFAVRRGHYAITDLFSPRGIYGAWGRRGLICYVVGLVSMIPFMVFLAYPAYTGVLAARLGGVDVSIVVGLMVSGGLYYLLSRSLDLTAEESTIRTSEQLLAEAELAAGSRTPTGR